MNQTWENGKKNPNFGPKIFFMGFTSIRCYTLLQAIIICNFKEKYEVGDDLDIWVLHVQIA